MNQDIELPVGLADSELHSYRREGSNVVVEVLAWNGRRVRASFQDVITLRDTLAGSFSDLVQNIPASKNTFQEALSQNFETVPASHPYQVYSFLNLDGEPSLEIVAASYQVTVA